MWSHGTVYWSELNTHDPERAKRFYADTVGWSFDPMPMSDGTYWVAKAGEMTVGGIFELKGELANVPEHWMTYVAVDDVDARVGKAKAAGASVIRPPFDIPGVGRIAILREPGGAVVGWMTPST
jgi:predicted enzyme related to lactoylglutathione lyase